MGSNNPLVIVVLVVILLLAGFLFLRGLAGPTVELSNAMIYYDMDKKEVYPHTKSQELPPVVRPSGAEGVQAHVFTCANCDDEQSRFVGYLRKYTDTQKQDMHQAWAENDMALRIETLEGAMIRVVDGTEWVPRMSDEGMAIHEAAVDRCEDGDDLDYAKECNLYYKPKKK